MDKQTNVQTYKWTNKIIVQAYKWISTDEQTYKGENIQMDKRANEENKTKWMN